MLNLFVKFSIFSCLRRQIIVHFLLLQNHGTSNASIWARLLGNQIDVSARSYSPMLVLIDIPYWVLIIKSKHLEIIELFREVLVYLNGDNHSSFLDDRVCVLWDMYQVTPLSIGLNYKGGIIIW